MSHFREGALDTAQLGGAPRSTSDIQKVIQLLKQFDRKQADTTKALEAEKSAHAKTRKRYTALYKALFDEMKKKYAHNQPVWVELEEALWELFGMYTVPNTDDQNSVRPPANREGTLPSLSAFKVQHADQRIPPSSQQPARQGLFPTGQDYEACYVQDNNRSSTQPNMRKERFENRFSAKAAPTQSGSLAADRHTKAQVLLACQNSTRSRQPPKAQDLLADSEPTQAAPTQDSCLDISTQLAQPKQRRISGLRLPSNSPTTSLPSSFFGSPRATYTGNESFSDSSQVVEGGTFATAGTSQARSLSDSGFFYVSNDPRPSSPPGLFPFHPLQGEQLVFRNYLPGTSIGQVGGLGARISQDTTDCEPKVGPYVRSSFFSKFASSMVASAGKQAQPSATNEITSGGARKKTLVRRLRSKKGRVENYDGDKR
ncbi:hypothetical protein CC80DRAFT_539612 [Byssothecium circinans]|uniref:Uncharacterized protein n=1 Tax=Byssothecium circinans TaxID=147558 RepID=A0A6A5TCL2_9PLEO|nr:hypothetical protein CC80DRAFT_539612 [Byssothecium circinans]